MLTIVSHSNHAYGSGQIEGVDGGRVASTRSRQQGKEQGVIQSGENRVLLLFSPFRLFQPRQFEAFRGGGICIH